MLILDTNTQIA